MDIRRVDCDDIEEVEYAHFSDASFHGNALADARQLASTLGCNYDIRSQGGGYSVIVFELPDGSYWKE